MPSLMASCLHLEEQLFRHCFDADDLHAKAPQFTPNAARGFRRKRCGQLLPQLGYRTRAEFRREGIRNHG